MKGQRTP
ncbi:hypothetical protein R3I93_018389 [Phoxinus phoxinus]